MNNTQLTRLKDVLSISTKTYKEDNMVLFLCNLLDTIPDVIYYKDHMDNIYATKGNLNEGEFYPMFIAHTDTVHELVDEIIVREEYLIKPPTFGKTYGNEKHYALKGYTKNGSPTGIGGDDKAGIFIALEMLRILPKVKIGLFVSEETGCHGSSNCDINFLKDVGYAIQFDAPGDNLITEICSGTRLYKQNGEFINIIKPLFEKTMGVKSDEQSHPYTDITQIKRKSDFSCINLSSGYYNMHRTDEFVVVEDVFKLIEFATESVNHLGLKKYQEELEQERFFDWTDINHLDDDVYEDIFYLENNEVIVDNGNVIIQDNLTKNIVELNEYEVLQLFNILQEKLMDREI